MSRYDSIRISNRSNLVINAVVDADCRKSQLYVSQKSVEKQVRDIHDRCKTPSTYLGTSIGYEDIDWYDSDCNMYEVAGASMSKGDRKVQDNSWSTGSIPKDWEKNITIKFKESTRIAKPIELSLSALGVYGVKASDIQKMLKKNKNIAYISRDGKVTAEDTQYDY